MTKKKAWTQFVVYSLIGAFMFFVPIKIAGRNSIPIDHLLTLIYKIPFYNLIYPLALVVIGVVMPFVTKSFKKSKVKTFLAFLNLIALPFIIMGVFKIGPASMLEEDMLPFIINNVVLNVCTIVPVGSIFLAFITSYGLMEFIGVYMRPIMRPLFNTPGRSAIEAVTSFVGSYSIALMITNKVYTRGYYTDREACIIGSGFATVSATFMIVIADNLGFLQSHWLLYFFTAFAITFLVTAITARIYPLASKPDTFYEGQEGKREQEVKSDKFKVAKELAIEKSMNAPDLLDNIKDNFADGIRLALNIAPSLMAIGTLGLILARFTPFFEYTGVIFYPFTKLLGFEDAMLVSKSLSMSLIEMFLPVIPMANADFISRFVIGIVVVSEILFFSASIPVIMATNIPLTLKDFVIIWYERVLLTIIIATPLSYFYFNVLGL